MHHRRTVLAHVEARARVMLATTSTRTRRFPRRMAAPPCTSTPRRTPVRPPDLPLCIASATGETGKTTTRPRCTSRPRASAPAPLSTALARRPSGLRRRRPPTRPPPVLRQLLRRLPRAAQHPGPLGDRAGRVDRRGRGGVGDGARDRVPPEAPRRAAGAVGGLGGQGDGVCGAGV